jgi:hypothetical protein
MCAIYHKSVLKYSRGCFRVSRNVGDRDETLPANRELDARLSDLKIPHILPCSRESGILPPVYSERWANRTVRFTALCSAPGKDSYLEKSIAQSCCRVRDPVIPRAVDVEGASGGRNPETDVLRDFTSYFQANLKRSSLIAASNTAIGSFNATRSKVSAARLGRRCPACQLRYDPTGTPRI